MTMFGRAARIVGLVAVITASVAPVVQAAPVPTLRTTALAALPVPEFDIFELVGDGKEVHDLFICVGNADGGFVTVTYENRIIGQSPNDCGTDVVLPQSLPSGNLDLVISFSGTDEVAEGSVTRISKVARRSSRIVVTPKPATYGVGTTVSATVKSDGHAPRATGTMNFSVGSAYISAPVVNGTATIRLGKTASAATTTVRAIYLGDRSNNSAQGSGQLTIRKATTSLRASVARSGTYGSTAAVTVSVSGPVTRPTGVVATTIGGKKYSANLNNGSATVTVPSNWVGRKALTFTYAGNRNFNTSSGRAVVNSVRGRTAVRGTAKSTQYGVAARMPVTVSGGGSAPTGRVTATIAGKGSAAGQLGNGRTTVSPTTSLEPGRYTVALAYGGSALHNGSKASSTLTVSRARTSLSASSEPVGWYDRATVRVSVRATRLSPTGSVSVYRGSRLLGSGRLSAGAANVKIAQLDPGWTDVTVKYSGDKRYVPTSAITTVEVWAWD